MVGYQQFEKDLADLARHVEHYQGLIKEWGIEQVVAHFAGLGAASGTIGSEFHRMVADANRLVGTKFLVGVLRNQEEQAEA